jgi:predicted metalloprotease with PDZ domain
MKYIVKFNNAERHYINLELVVDTSKVNSLKMQLPAWRPGRYELGNFAKNIKDFSVLSGDGKTIPFTKKTKDLWQIECTEFTQVNVSYSYYASELNAGSTFLDNNQLYINPVNCMLYNVDDYGASFEIEFSIPSDYHLYSSLKSISKNTLYATNFEELADSPIIASNNAQSKSITLNNINFNFCFQGEINIDWNRLLQDFKLFIEYQIQLFGSFPHKDFLFLFQITPYRSYHGVEHHKSTVILLGPSYDIFKNFYSELLGVSSHELYHVWNVKNIRPQEMAPYDFSRENYTQMGYVTEGVTTYMGDRILYESGVFSLNQYFEELQKLFQRHFHNDGRNHYSVAESSWDSWLDGYVAGAPGRKVSIYVEGALISLICDAKIRKSTSYKKSLHDVMKSMYQGSDKLSPYDKKIYKEKLESISKSSFDDVFNNLIYNTLDFSNYLESALEVFGWKYEIEKSKNWSWQYGFKTKSTSGKVEIENVLEKSAAYNSSLVFKDQIIAVNNFYLENNLEHWLEYFKDEDVVLTINRGGRVLELKINKRNNYQYFNYKISKI